MQCVRRRYEHANPTSVASAHRPDGGWRCRGLANYFGIDPIFVRLGFVVVSFFNGIGVVLYIVLWLLMPNEDAAPTDNNLDVAVGEMRAIVERIIGDIQDIFRR